MGQLPDLIASSEGLETALRELVRGAEALDLPLSAVAVSRFRIYLETLLHWRRAAALTATADPIAIVRMHVIDALHVCRYLPAGCRVADLGSGAGFPGLVLAIAREDVSVALIEPRRKKTNFLREVVRATGVRNVEIFEERAEAIISKRPPLWDVVVSRAVWKLARFLTISESLLRPGGLAIAMKGPKADNEISTYHGPLTPLETVTYRLHGRTGRCLLRYRKV